MSSVTCHLVFLVRQFPRVSLSAPLYLASPLSRAQWPPWAVALTLGRWLCHFN